MLIAYSMNVILGLFIMHEVINIQVIIISSYQVSNFPLVYGTYLLVYTLQ